MPLRIAYAPGVTLTRWTTAWQERFRAIPLEFVPTGPETQVEVLRSRDADVSFVRLPADTDGLHVIPLYSEVAVVLLPKDHSLADAASLTLDQLDDDAVVVPHAIGRANAGRDRIAVPVSDAEQTGVGLAWLDGDDNPDIQEWIGVVRGRTANSSRSTPQPERQETKRSAGRDGSARPRRSRR